MVLMEGGVNCEWCELQQAVLNCTKCELHLCVQCDESLHRKGARAQHGRAPILGTRRMEPQNRPVLSPCEECDEPNSASWLCMDCDQQLCDACKLRLHLKGAATRHILQRSEPFLELQRFQIRVEGAPNPFPQRQQSFLHRQAALANMLQPAILPPAVTHIQPLPLPAGVLAAAAPLAPSLQAVPQPQPAQQQHQQPSAQPQYPAAPAQPHITQAISSPPVLGGVQHDLDDQAADEGRKDNDGNGEEGREEVVIDAMEGEVQSEGVALGMPLGMEVPGERPMVYSEMLAEESCDGQREIAPWAQLAPMGTGVQAVQSVDVCPRCSAESMQCTCLTAATSGAPLASQGQGPIVLALPPPLQTSPRGRPSLSDGGHMVAVQNADEQQLVLQSQMVVELQGMDDALDLMDQTGKKRKKCNYPKCAKFAQGSTAFCIKHGGGRRCEHPTCPNSAAGRSSFCGRHGGGRRCNYPGCSHSCKSNQALCVSHGGGRRCVAVGCMRGAIGASEVCTKHGGGPRCQADGCTKRAEGQQMPFCIAHGGGKRCRYPMCSVSAVRPTDFCKKHGGGKRCSHQGCGKTAVARSKFCARHGGLPRCEMEGCTKRAQDKTMLCKKHGGGKRCETQDCTKSAQSGSRFCSRHGPGRRCEYPNCIKKVKGELNICGYHRRRAEKMILPEKDGNPLALGPSFGEGSVPMLLTAPPGPPPTLNHAYSLNTSQAHAPHAEVGTSSNIQTHVPNLTGSSIPNHNDPRMRVKHAMAFPPHAGEAAIGVRLPERGGGPTVVFTQPEMGIVTGLLGSGGDLSMHMQRHQVVGLELNQDMDDAMQLDESAAMAAGAPSSLMETGADPHAGDADLGESMAAGPGTVDAVMSGAMEREGAMGGQGPSLGNGESVHMADVGVEGNCLSSRAELVEGMEAVVHDEVAAAMGELRSESNENGSTMDHVYGDVDFAGGEEVGLDLGSGAAEERLPEQAEAVGTGFHDSLPLDAEARAAGSTSTDGTTTGQEVDAAGLSPSLPSLTDRGVSEPEGTISSVASFEVDEMGVHRDDASGEQCMAGSLPLYQSGLAAAARAEEGPPAVLAAGSEHVSAGFGASSPGQAGPLGFLVLADEQRTADGGTGGEDFVMVRCGTNGGDSQPESDGVTTPAAVSEMQPIKAEASEDVGPMPSTAVVPSEMSPFIEVVDAV